MTCEHNSLSFIYCCTKQVHLTVARSVHFNQVESLWVTIACQTSQPSVQVLFNSIKTHVPPEQTYACNGLSPSWSFSLCRYPGDQLTCSVSSVERYKEILKNTHHRSERAKNSFRCTCRPGLSRTRMDQQYGYTTPLLNVKEKAIHIHVLMCMELTLCTILYINYTTITKQCKVF